MFMTSKQTTTSSGALTLTHHRMPDLTEGDATLAMLERHLRDLATLREVAGRLMDSLDRPDLYPGAPASSPAEIARCRRMMAKEIKANMAQERETAEFYKRRLAELGIVR